MTWTAETYGQRVYYGPVFRCDCLQFVGDSGQYVYSIPYPSLNTENVMVAELKAKAKAPPVSGIPLLAMGRPLDPVMER